MDQSYFLFTVPEKNLGAIEKRYHRHFRLEDQGSSQLFKNRKKEKKKKVGKFRNGNKTAFRCFYVETATYCSLCSFRRIPARSRGRFFGAFFYLYKRLYETFHETP